MELSRSKIDTEVGISERLRALDPILLLASLALTGFGILAVYIAGSDGGGSYALNQTLGFVVGLVGAVPLALIDYRRLKKYLPAIYGLTLLMLLAVTISGISAKGAQRWIDIGPVQVQPSEFAKLLIVVVLAGYFSEHRAGDTKNFIKSLGILGVPALLVFAQPDLGTALVFGAVFFTMAFIGGARLRQIGLLAISGVVLFALALKLGILKEYQVARLTAFLDPTGATSESYQVSQSMTAIGSGGLTGKGLDGMTLANLGFLPEDHTDFIFSNLAEKTGFVGGLLLLGLFFVLVWRMLHVATVSRDRFGVLIAVGVATIFLFHIFVNIGMTMGIMPVTGIPLPFISYGRSSLVVSVISLGLLQSIAMRSKEGYKGMDA
ncbi:MAG: Rod shape-determining protein RodA [uncultured Rubrobacteraceae bacterium]|uniref:Peptidoglycan glycosyltransferase RodA n=1 Tax=uncultured Rubrobacteraceae bacterium TaxID=349277 RepID=A0A6J4QVM9_9ACTN|nr:MAG: Rod shape-determining protein RodA [uncultured Rubrobacteraceae bacterium]